MQVLPLGLNLPLQGRVPYQLGWKGGAIVSYSSSRRLFAISFKGFLGMRHVPLVTLAASLMRYEYDSGEKRFQEQLQLIYSKQELQKFCYYISFGQTSEHSLEIELNFKKDKLL